MVRNLFDVLRKARIQGAPVSTHYPTGNIIIAGHRWDRWADLHDKPDPVIVRPGINGGGSKVSAA